MIIISYVPCPIQTFLEYLFYRVQTTDMYAYYDYQVYFSWRFIIEMNFLYCINSFIRFANFNNLILIKYLYLKICILVCFVLFFSDSPSCGPSALSNPPPCSPEESKKRESRGTKRKQPGSDTKVHARLMIRSIGQNTAESVFDEKPQFYWFIGT